MTDVISDAPADVPEPSDSIPTLGLRPGAIVPAYEAPAPVVPDTFSTADLEPVRLPMWASIAGSAAVAFAVQMLTGVPVRGALAALLAGVGPLLFGTEVARQRAWSAPAVLGAAQQARDDGIREGAKAQRAVTRAATPPTQGG